MHIDQVKQQSEQRACAQERYRAARVTLLPAACHADKDGGIDEGKDAMNKTGQEQHKHVRCGMQYGRCNDVRGQNDGGRQAYVAIQGCRQGHRAQPPEQQLQQGGRGARDQAGTSKAGRRILRQAGMFFLIRDEVQFGLFLDKNTRPFWLSAELTEASKPGKVDLQRFLLWW
jgi:hypothetical protein